MKLVKVEWEDTVARNYWSDIGDLHVSKVSSVGFLVGKDKRKIILSGMNSKDGQHNCTQVIPRGCITKITELKEKE